MTDADRTPREDEQQRTAEALRERDELLRVLTEHASEFIRLLDLDGRNVYASPSVVRFYGRVPTTLFETAHPEELENCRRWWEQVLAGENARLHWRARNASGEWRWLETSGALVTYHGKPHVLTICRDVTEATEAEDALRRSERKLAEAGRIAHVGFWENDLETDRITWSEETCRIAGLPLGQGVLTLAAYQELIHPEDRATQAAATARALRGDAPYDVEYRLVRPNGEVRYVRSVGEVTRDESGRPRRAFGVVQDITERKRAENALKDSERLVRQVLEALPVGVAVVNLSGDIIFSNPASRRIWGGMITPGAERYGKSEGWWHDSGKRIAPEEWASARAVTKGETSINELIDIEAFDGVRRIIRNSAVPIRGDDGTITGAVVINEEVTDRIGAEEALRAAEMRLEHVVASSPAVLFTLRADDGRFRAISWMSANIEAMLGYRVDETLGRDWWWDNVHPDDRDAVVNQSQSEILGRGYVSAEYRFRHKDGRYRWIRGENRLLRDADGHPTEVVGSLSDVTERKRLEDRFRQAQKMEALGQLAGGVAHDFNNALTIISGYSEILLPGLPPTDPRRETMLHIQRAAERAAGLTRQLLAFSRQTVLEPRVLDLNDVVRENERMLRRLIGEDVQLTAVLDPALEPVKVDPGQVGQAIMNLAVNARDAMPTGGKLTIETSNIRLDESSVAMDPEARPGRYVLLAVTDTGTGIAPEVRAHLFEPFFTTKEPGKGTGLGLATVYGVVKQSGGFIFVNSEPGGGTAFRMFFPVAEGPVSTAKPPLGSGTMAPGTETILLVEDEDTVRLLVGDVLKEAGYTVLDAGNGSAALLLASEHAGPVHLLITDVVMPEMGGRQLVERLTPLRPDLKVLYLSGYTDDAVVRHGVLQAEVAFLQKPFTMAALTSKVRQVLDTAPLARPRLGGRSEGQT